MPDKTYNGYTNYETWNVALWIDNDQGEQEYWIEQTRQAKNVYELEAILKEYHNQNMPEVRGTYADLLQAALDSVNWMEIAENFWEEYREDEEEDTEDEEE